MKPLVLEYAVGAHSPSEDECTPRRVKEHAPRDANSRWCTQKHDQNQFLELVLAEPAVVHSITFGKYYKNHPCNVKDLYLYGAPAHFPNEALFSEHTWILLKKVSLENTPEDETFLLPQTHNASLLTLRKLAVLPRSTWHHNYNYSIWHISLHGWSHGLVPNSSTPTEPVCSGPGVGVGVGPVGTSLMGVLRGILDEPSKKGVVGTEAYARIEEVLSEHFAQEEYASVFLTETTRATVETISPPTQALVLSVFFNISESLLYVFTEYNGGPATYVLQETVWEGAPSIYPPTNKVFSVFSGKYVFLPYTCLLASGELSKIDITQNTSTRIQDTESRSIKRIRIISSPISRKIYVYTQAMEDIYTERVVTEERTFEVVDVDTCERTVLRKEASSVGSSPSIPKDFRSATVLPGWKERLPCVSNTDTSKDVVCFLSLTNRCVLLYSVSSNSVFKSIDLPPQEESFLDKVSIHCGRLPSPEHPYSEVVFRAGGRLYLYSVESACWVKVATSLCQKKSVLGFGRVLYLVDNDTLETERLVLESTKEDTLFRRAVLCVRVALFRSLIKNQPALALEYFQKRVVSLAESIGGEKANVLHLVNELVSGMFSAPDLIKELANTLIR
ncbi:hypothetical protein NEDG_00492 [Nematocida displodere]|uniref:Muskelin N-terminal domain-containing protein n=1 Tax=Nematocida displodere TaxID=1805483 RepID=A0A177EJ94_9MICR|nr:hypothetical protein NEDG_00492 [Nematocida displodere]